MHPSELAAIFSGMLMVAIGVLVLYVVAVLMVIPWEKMVGRSAPKGERFSGTDGHQK